MLRNDLDDLVATTPENGAAELAPLDARRPAASPTPAQNGWQPRVPGPETGTSAGGTRPMPEILSLIEAEIPHLRRFARYLARDIDRGDDLVQECLMWAIAKHHTWTPGTNLRAWLFTILVNLVRSDARRDKTRGTVVTIDDYRHLISSPAVQDDALRMRDLRRAFARLAAPFQEVLILVTLEGLSYEEAAEVIGVPVGTVRSRLFRAREQIKRHMEEPARAGPGKSRPAVARRAPASRGTDRVPAVATG